MTKTWRQVIAGLEVLGGLAGVAFLLWELARVQVDALTLLLALLILLMYALSVIAGVLLWREHRWGRITSIIVQAIQLPKIISPILIFNMCFGLDLYTYLVAGTNGFMSVGIEFKFLAFYQFHINTGIPATGLGVSIPACIFLARLIAYKTTPEQPALFNVPLPTDPRYWPAAADSTQEQFKQQSLPHATDNPDNPGQDQQT